MQDLSRFVPNVHFEQIPIKNLVSNQEYQRPLSQAQVEKAIEDFDLNQINPVKVSRRDGINYVFNGQHTIEIVATVSGSRETPVWCMIYDSLDYQNEADIFANQMKHVRPLKPFCSSLNLFLSSPLIHAIFAISFCRFLCGNEKRGDYGYFAVKHSHFIIRPFRLREKGRVYKNGSCNRHTIH